MLNKILLFQLVIATKFLVGLSCDCRIHNRDKLVCKDEGSDLCLIDNNHCRNHSSHIHNVFVDGSMSNASQVSCFRRVKVLSVRNAHLSQVIRVNEISSLVLLDLSHNRIRHLNDSSELNTALVELVLNDNLIEFIDKSYFLKLPRLLRLNLANNRLTCIDLNF